MIEQRITLRYDAQQIPAIVQAVQGDTGRDVIFELADYEIPAGATANYYIDKPDDTAIYNSAEVISSTEILAHLTEQALAVPGRNNGQVRILSDGEVITSFDFVLEVAAFRGILHMQSETEINIFDQAIEDAVNTATEEAVAEIQAQTPVVTGMQSSIAPTYSSSSTYAVGDYVMYNAQLYRCITEITTAEAWTVEHWTQVPIAPEVSDLKSAIDILESIAFTDYDGNIITEQGKYINYAGVRGDASWNTLYNLTPANGQLVKITTTAPLNAVPAFYYNGVPYPSESTVPGEYIGYITGDGSSMLRVNSTPETVPKIEVDAHAQKSEIEALDSALGVVESGLSMAVTEAETTKTANRYINFSGVRGDVAWCNMYSFVPESGKTYCVKTHVAGVIPAYYFSRPFPDSTQSDNYDYIGYITGDGVTPCYVNANILAEGNDKADIRLCHFASQEIAEITNNLSTISEKERALHVTTTDTVNRFILSNGVQGNLDGYTLKVFTTVPDAVYLIYSEVEPIRAAGNFPIVYHDGITYTNNTGKGYYIIIGNGQKCFVNSLSDIETIIDMYAFKAYVDRTPNILRMYNNIVCCGDSLTYSQVYTSNNAQRQALVPYPKVIEKISGTQTDILATPGFTSQNWWETYNEQIVGKNKLYIIFLGTNDSNETLTDTADTDCAGDDLTQYATNATGYYGRIIRKVLDTESKCILIKINLGTTGNQRNQAISGLGTRFNVPVIESPQYVLNDSYYHYGDTTDYMNTVHLNDLGYAAYAELIADEINSLPLSTKYSLMPKT